MQGKAGEASGEAPDGPDQRALRSEAPAGYDDSGIERELVVMDQSSCLRWFQHDFPDLLARWHYHPELELHLITASTGTAMIGGQARAFEPGSLYLLGGGVPHNWVSVLDGRRSVPGRDVLLQMHPDRLRELERIVPDLRGVGELLHRARHGLAFHGRTADEVADLLVRMGSETDARRFSTALTAFAAILEASPDDVEVIDPNYVPATPEGTSHADISAALTYMHENLEEPLRLAAVAEVLGTSESTASRMLTRATTHGFSRILIGLRITEALRLLRTTDKHVSDICWRCGFTTLSAFTRHFRPQTHTTPSAYRRKLGSGESSPLGSGTTHSSPPPPAAPSSTQ